MSETLTVELHNRTQAWAVIQQQVFPFLKAVLQGGTAGFSRSNPKPAARRRTV